jgi:ribosomal protein S18 acetylase RimI-like enzyme
MFSIRSLTDDDCVWVRQWMVNHWGAELMIVHGEQLYPVEYPGFVAETGTDVVGLVTYILRGDECEILTLDSLAEGQGIGSALIEAVRKIALEKGARRLWLITTNDNLHALRFYQKRGFELVKIHRHAVDESRELKPSIPLVGDSGIPIRDEIELEILLASEHAGLG